MEPAQGAIQPASAVANDPTADPLARFRRRGRILFTFLAFWSVVIGGVVITAGGVDRPGLSVLVAAIGLVIGVAVAWALVVGLNAGRPWADRATVIVCGILVAAGVIRSLIRLSDGAIDIPLDAIGAALVLAVRPSALPVARPGDGRRIGLVVAATLVSAFWPLVGDAVASGRLLGAAPDGVSVQVTVDCSAIAADPAAPIVARASWTWTDGELLSGSTDGFVVWWSATTDADPPEANAETSGGVIVDGEVEMAPADAVWSGSGSPAAALTDPFEMEGNARTFGIDVARSGLVDGHVVLPLRPLAREARHGSVRVQAGYAHLDRWLKESDPVDCDW